MENSLELYTVSIYTENNIGLLNRISAIFQRRHINIESINISISEIPNVSRWTVVVQLDEDNMNKILGQIERQVEVIKAYAHRPDEIHYHETCLIKMNASALLESDVVTGLIEKNKLRLVTANSVFCVCEFSGTNHEIHQFYEKLKPLGIMQFVRSGRIAVSKEEMNISSMLEALN